MSGRWADSTRKARLPANWAELVRATMIRCGGRCEALLPSGRRCPRKATECDHIVPGDDHSLGNLQGLCVTHHRRKTGREAWASRQRPDAARPPEAHPGARLGREH